MKQLSVDQTRAIYACAVALAIAAAAWGAQDLRSNRKGEGVLYLDHSLNARLHTVPVQAVHLSDGFWSARRRVTTERSLPTLLLLLEEHGVIDNFRRLAGHAELPRRGPLYTDSDLYKWIEGASWALASNETAEADKQKLRSDIETLIGYIVAAQEPSGYIDTYFAGDKAHLRFTDLTHSHEGYCLGHLIQAGIAYYRATGNRTLLDAGIRFADYVVDNFGPTKRPFITGHPELEMALVELYRTTGDARYLEFTRYLFSGVEKDRLKLKDSEIRYMFSGKPFVSRTEFEGHAVRALYAASGATDYFTEAGDPAFKRTLDLLWTDLTMRKMYITGGAGSRSAGESFGDPYELPNEQAYAETCAAVANVMWNFRMLMLTGDARYADVLERTLYNGANSGLSLSGNLYCYRNPLASSGEKLRAPWYDTTCCPPNIERLLEALPGYMYALGRDGVYVNLYDNSELDWHLEDGVGLKLSQSTNYPWSGEVRLTVTPAHSSDFSVYLRWPFWATSAEVAVNGQPVQTAGSKRGSYIQIARTWNAGDAITISFPMQPVPMVANPRVADDFGRTALQRGPIVYALEQIDQGGAALGDIYFRSNSSVSAEVRKDLLGGVTVLKTPGLVAEKSLADEPLYESMPASHSRPKRPINLTFIPYYSIGNREPTPMEVWVPVSRFEGSPAPQTAANIENHF
ncbi:MAG: glycoside hydrolase family 127 protein [Acidobacteriaceae bacterium]|nr:glycoside hydrolase family 127 protein [Acidobacteriaceae bacterium]